MTESKETLVKKIESMKLSEISKRLLFIQNELRSNKDEVIDILIPLTEEAQLLKERADFLIGDIEKYLMEKN